MNQHRRTFLVAAAGLAVSSFSRVQSGGGQDSSRTRLILLGTKGGPRVSIGRANPSTLLLVGGTPYLIDCGYGTTRQLLAANVALNTVRYVFITHHHSDHNLEFGPLLHNSWVTGLPMQVDAYGPPGLNQLTRSFFDSMKIDIDTRMADEGRPDLRRMVTTHDVERAGVVVQNDRMKITAALVRHPPFAHAFAYRFDASDRSIVISGDTTYAPAL